MINLSNTRNGQQSNNYISGAIYGLFFFFKGKRLLSIFLASYLMLCIFNCLGSRTSSSSSSSLNMLDTTASTRVRSSSVTFSSINLKREFYKKVNGFNEKIKNMNSQILSNEEYAAGFHSFFLKIKCLKGKENK